MGKIFIYNYLEISETIYIFANTNFDSYKSELDNQGDLPEHNYFSRNIF